MPDPIIDSPVQGQSAEVHSAESIPGGTIEWRNSIPAELRSEKSLANIKDLSSLVKGYVESQKYIGGAVRIPGEGAKPEEVKSFHSKLGVPEKVEDYKIAKPILPSHAGWDDTVHSKILEAAHGANLTKKQAEKFVESLAGVVSGMSENPVEILNKNKAALQDKWKDNFGRNLILATRGAEHLGGQELLKALEETGAGMHPVIVEALSNFGSGLLEQGLIKNEETKLETRQDAEAKIKAIKAEGLKHPYYDASHSNHADAVDEYRRLMQLIEANK